MKKLVAVFTMLVAFTISANAQDKQQVIEAAAKNDAVEMTKYLGLTESEQENFIALFKKKHQVMQDPNASEERKEKMRQIVEMKISASINGEQQEKLNANPELLKKLIN